MNQRELSARADRNLSSYEGVEMDFGRKDDLLHFDGGAQDFSNEDASNLSFSMTLSNTGESAKDRTVALCPGYFAKPADIKDGQGNPVDAIVSDGNFIAESGAVVTGKGKPKLIKEFLAFIKSNPMRFTGIKMLVDNPDQLEEDLYIKKLSPFRNLEDQTIIPSNFKNSKQNDDKRVEIPLNNFQLDNQTILIFTLKAGRTVTFNFFAGAILNTAAALDKKAKRARDGFTREF